MQRGIGRVDGVFGSSSNLAILTIHENNVFHEWGCLGSNQGHLLYKSSALPLSYSPDARVLYQIPNRSLAWVMIWPTIRRKSHPAARAATG